MVSGNNPTRLYCNQLRQVFQEQLIQRVNKCVLAAELRCDRLLNLKGKGVIRAPIGPQSEKGGHTNTAHQCSPVGESGDRGPVWALIGGEVVQIQHANTTQLNRSRPLSPEMCLWMQSRLDLAAPSISGAANSESERMRAVQRGNRMIGVPIGPRSGGRSYNYTMQIQHN